MAKKKTEFSELQTEFEAALREIDDCVAANRLPDAASVARALRALWAKQDETGKAAVALARMASLGLPIL